MTSYSDRTKYSILLRNAQQNPRAYLLLRKESWTTSRIIRIIEINYLELLNRAAFSLRVYEVWNVSRG